MQLESHATPSLETPEQRYATLHRAIERGLASDELWKELAEVSLRLGHSDEAVRCARQIESETTRGLLESRLRRLGLLPALTNAGPTAAPAASNAGAPKSTIEHAGEEPGLVDHLLDAFQYLFHQHMPWLVLVTTLAFPLVIGVGGFLTAGESPWMLAAIAALPGLCVLAVVGAMGRQIMVASSEGNGDVPPIPDFAELVDDARRFVIDSVLVFSSLIAPSLIAMALGAPRSTTIPGLTIGALLAPLMWTLRQMRGDLRALAPMTMMRALARSGFSYFGPGLATCLMFTPAVVVAWSIVDRPVWVQLAVIGPLCVVPIFAASRLFGTWIDSHRAQLGSLLLLTRHGKPKASAMASDEELSQPRFPRRPDSLRNFKAPVARKVAAKPVATPTPPPAPAPRADVRARATPTATPTAPARPTATPTAPRASQPRAAAQKATTPTASAPKPAAQPKPEPRSIEGRGPRRKPAEGPDLAHMPGAVVLSGSERERLAAAKKR